MWSNIQTATANKKVPMKPDRSETGNVDAPEVGEADAAALPVDEACAAFSVAVACPADADAVAATESPRFANALVLFVDVNTVLTNHCAASLLYFLK